MSSRPAGRIKSADKARIEQAKRQIIQCECIIRKVLAIHNCFEELRNLDREYCKQQKAQAHSASTHSSHGSGSATKTQNGQHENTVSSPTTPILKPVASHRSTPMTERSAPSILSPSVPQVKPVSMHIPTPVPVHGLSYLAPSSKRLSTDSTELPSKRASLTAEDAKLLYPESVLHTPTKRRKSTSCIGEYTVHESDDSDESSRHIQWVDKVSHNPLVQGTPPPSRPLHRESIALKPCMESPDIHTKEKLAEQRLAMIEMERRRHLREQERTWTRLF